MTSQPLPSYQNPPLIETVMGVFFRPLAQLDAVQIGQFWIQHLRDSFPQYELREPAEEFLEELADHGIGKRRVWKLLDRPDTPRLWAKNPDQDHIVQVQQNALMTNWLRKPGGASYLPYSSRRDAFAQLAEQLKAFVHAVSGEPAFSMTSCFVTYINHIVAEGRTSLDSLASSTIQSWSGNTVDSWLPPPDRLQYQVSYPIPDAKGRLSVSISPVITPSGSNQVLQMELTARVSCADLNLQNIYANLDLAHEWVVRGFSSLTTTSMHERWGRR